MLIGSDANSLQSEATMEDLWRVCDLADQATHQRLIRGFRREEEENNRRQLLFGDDHLEKPPEQSPRGN